MRILLNTLAAGFAYCIYWAITKKPISESGAWLMSDPWGIVTLVDLYLGLLLFAIFMCATCSKKRLLALWVPALMILGNVIALIYLGFYYVELKKLFGAKNENK